MIIFSLPQETMPTCKTISFCLQTVVHGTNKAVPNIDIDQAKSVLSSIELSPVDVYTHFNDLPHSKASGPDGVSNRKRNR